MKKYLSFVKFPHTIFALPFALVGYFAGIYQAGHGFEWSDFILVLLCMVFARNAAMGFNRWADRHIDAKNPRTAIREIPTGKISPQHAMWFVIANAAAFIFATYFINYLCFALSPVALFVILGYSYTKRFTWLCHFVLGLGLALAPIGAYLAVTASFDFAIVALGIAVLLWTSGFDIIYGLQDVSFDKSQALYSVPSALGPRKAMLLSNILHFLAAAFISYFTIWLVDNYDNAAYLSFIGLGVFILLLLYQHLIISVDDLSKVNLAFFTTNGIASLVYGVAVILDFLI